MMKSILLFATLLFIAPTIDKTSFYKAFESSSSTSIDGKIKELEKIQSSASKDAYIGALKMKKAETVDKTKEKLNLFNTGKELLEKAIKKAPSNVEFKFLRLVIQENAPKILKYKSDITSDASIIQMKFSSLDKVVQKVIKAYSSSSEHLNAKDFK